MVLGSSPFTSPSPGLRNIDLIVSGHLLKQIVLEKIPTAQDVSFASEKDVAAAASHLGSSEVHKLCASVFSHNTPVRLEPDKIVLPLAVIDRENLALLISGLDDVMIKSTDEQWLRDTGSEIVGEFLDKRSAELDPLTGLYAVARFNQFISARVVDEGDHIILVESLPSALSVKDALSHVSRTSRLLEEFNRFSFPLFYLGNSIFCFVICRRESIFVKSFCTSLTTFGRNSGLKKIRAGISSYRPERHDRGGGEQVSTAILDEAWQALQKAGRRGPYAFCDYELLVNPAVFPLSPPSSSSVGKIVYRVQNSDTFSLIYFKPDFENKELIDAIIDDYFANETVVFDPEGYVVIKTGHGEKSAKQWAESLIRRVLKDHGKGYSMSAGIGSYPFREYKKSEIIKNCRKALLHGSFFGPASSVIFDALSLNVSGDAYFGESDLYGAIREYRRGLDLSPNDVNLLNSLGVTYALMNRTVKAQEVFDQVLAIDPENFMARFNKGLGEKKLEDYRAAVDSFTLALKYLDAEDEEERSVVPDLRFQLGVCLYNTKDYRQAVSVLEKYFESTKNQPGHERCFSYIGKSYYHLHQLKPAATWLQRGLNVSQSDAESLGLLGLIYLKTGEGNDIALRLSEKSVEIDPDSLQSRVRYAQVLEGCGEVQKAADIYSYCARSKKTRPAAWLGMARLHIAGSEFGRAERYLTRVARLEDLDSETRYEVDRLNEKLKNIT